MSPENILEIKQVVFELVKTMPENFDLAVLFCAPLLLALTLLLGKVYRPNGNPAKVRSWHRCYALIILLSNIVAIGFATWQIYSALFTDNALSNTAISGLYTTYKTALILLGCTLLINLSTVSQVNVKKLPRLQSLTEFDIVLAMAFAVACAGAHFKVLNTFTKIFALNDTFSVEPLHHLWLAILAYFIILPFAQQVSKTKFFRLIRQQLRYFGYGLPARNLENFISTKPKMRRMTRPDRSAFLVRRNLSQLQENPAESLSYIMQQLTLLTRYAMSNSKRCTLAEIYAPPIIALYYQTLSRHQNDGQIPEKEQKSNDINDAIRALNLLREVYSVVFSDVYPLSNWQFGPQRAIFRTAAIRIIELVYLEQQLAACHYKTVCSESWRAINTVYAIMNACETVTYNHPLLQSQKRNKQQALRENILTHYLQIQTAAFWDLMCLPTYTIPTLFRYIKSNLDALCLGQMGSEHLTQYHLVIAQSFEHGPLQSTKATETLSRLKVECPIYTLNISSLMLQLDHDHAQLTLEAKRKNPSGDKHNFFKRFSPAERRTILRHFREALFMKEETKATLTLGAKGLKQMHLWIYVGFKDCFNMALDEGKSNDFDDGRVLRNKLAERSAILGDDDQCETETQWYNFYENKNFIGIRTRENPYTLPMRIGRLLIYDERKGNISKPQLGLISRLERKGGNKVDILIRRFIGNIEVVAYLYKDPDGKEKEDKPVKQAALKVTDNRNRQLLIFPSNIPCAEGQTLVLLRANGKVPMQFGKIAIQNEDIIICNLRHKKFEKQSKASNQN